MKELKRELKSKQVNKQASKQVSKQASKQVGKQAIGRHSVGAMPCRRGLFNSDSTLTQL